jgi:hypothetical protein
VVCRHAIKEYVSLHMHFPGKSNMIHIDSLDMTCLVATHAAGIEFQQLLSLQ